MGDIIHFPIRIDLGGFKVIKGIGGREILILLCCIAGAVLFLFSGDNSGLLIRLLIGVPIAAFIFMASLIPIRGYKVEQFLWIVLSYQLAPKIFVRQSARPVEVPLDDKPTPKKPTADQKTEKGTPKWQMPKPSISIPKPSFELNLPRATAFAIVVAFLILALFSTFILYYNR